MMQLRILPRANRDIDEILIRFVELEAVRTGVRFLDASDKSFELLTHSPEIASAWETSNPRLKAIRDWGVKGFRNHLIFFRIHQNKYVDVMRVLHGARDLESLLASTCRNLEE